MYVVIGLVSFVVGLVLSYRGLRPRRVGRTPHCRRCGYNLTGLTSGRCPECGSLLAGKGVVVGVRRKRPVLVLAGGLLLSASAGAAYVVIVTTDWTPYKPTVWLMGELISPNQTRARKVWTELLRRDGLGRLSAGRRSALYDLCLTEQARPMKRAALAIEMVNFLAGAYQDGRLSAEQTETFFKQLVELRLRVRRTVVSSRAVPYEIFELDRGPTRPFWNKPILGEAAVDGVALDDRITLGGTLHGFGTGSRHRFGLPAQRRGKHTLTVRLTASLYNVPARSDADNYPFRTIPVVLEETFEVLEVEPADYIRLAHEPELDKAVRAAIVPGSLSFNPYAGNRMECTFRITEPPIGLAFEVFVRFGGVAYPLGTLRSERGRGVMVQPLVGTISATPPEYVEVVLRPSPGVAQDTVDLFEIYGGELVYPEIYVRGVSAEP